MIYDPTDVNMAMNSVGVLFYRRPEDSGQNLWVELRENIRKESADFRRPEW